MKGSLCLLRPYRAALALALALCLPAAGFAQSFNGTILGTVRDEGGAFLPGTRITVLNPETGYERTAVADEQGNYSFVNVPVGTYTVRAEADGFKTSAVDGLVVHVARDSRLNFSLEVGALSETVTVTAEAPVVQTDSSTVSTTVTERQIVNLPLNGRDYTQLAALAPGATYSPSNGWSSNVQINGNRAAKTEFLIDGAANTETWSGGALLSPSVDAIEEFRVQTSLSPAEFGHGSGFVNATTKSGTNELHGSLYEFHRNDALDARNFFAIEKPKLIRNQFGGAVGGPVLRDRLFFYADYEQLVERQERTANTRVPTDAIRQGDFSASPVPVVDPLTGQPFPGNRIPADRISPIARYFQSYVPGPNSGADRLILNNPAPIDQQQFSVRSDYQMEATRLTGRYIYGTNERSNAFGGRIYADSFLGDTSQDVATHNAMLSLTHSFSPELLVELRASYYFNSFYQYTPSDDGVNHTVESGIGGFGLTTAGLESGGFPLLQIATYGGIPGGTFLDVLVKQQVQTYLATATWARGSHTLKAGVEHRRERGTSGNYMFAKGLFNFSGQYTGDPYADFLLGFPNYSYRSFPQDQWGSQLSAWHAYVQDDWQVHPRLTLNLGLRLEWNPWPEPLRSGANFDPRIGKIVIASRDGQIDFFQQVGRFAYEANPEWYVTSEQVGAPFSLVESKGGVFNPRAGFAWRPFGGTDTVVRGGVGIFSVPFLGQISRGAPIVNPPWQVSEFRLATAPTPWATFWPEITEETGFQPPLVTAVDPVFYNATSTQWNLLVERRLPGDMGLSVGYVGNKGTHLQMSTNINQPEFGPNSFAEVPFPQYGTFAQGFHSRGNSSYNALQVQLDKRYSHGLGLLASYSWSKTIDYTSDDATFASDRFNIAVDRGLAAYDTGHRFVTSFVYDLPFGPGRRWGAGARGLLGGLIGGWRLTGIVTLQSGPPFTVFSTYDTSGFFVASGQRADRFCGGRLDDPTPERWFDTDCFGLATPYTVGSSGRNVLRGDALQNVDLGLHKDITVTETNTLQLRVEAFNAFNHATFGLPYNYIGYPTSGQVTTASPGRIVQLGLKYYF